VCRKVEIVGLSGGSVRLMGWGGCGFGVSAMCLYTHAPCRPAIGYLHSKYVTHGDVSLENTMVNLQTMTLCVIDFGLGAVTDGLGASHQLDARPIGRGKAYCLAPEVSVCVCGASGPTSSPYHSSIPRHPQHSLSALCAPALPPPPSASSTPPPGPPTPLSPSLHSTTK
jgi:serine/threonine protein kinase